MTDIKALTQPYPSVLEFQDHWRYGSGTTVKVSGFKPRVQAQAEGQVSHFSKSMHLTDTL